MHWQVVDDIPGPEPQDVRLASVRDGVDWPSSIFNVDIGVSGHKLVDSRDILMGDEKITNE